MERYTIGIDVGGTKTAYGVLNGQKELVRSLTHPSNAECSPEAFFDQIAANVRELMAACSITNASLLGVGLGMPSFILYDEGYIIKTSNLVKIKEFSVLCKREAGLLRLLFLARKYKKGGRISTP